MTQSEFLGWHPGICIAVTPQALPGWRSHTEQQGHLAFLLASASKAPPSQAQCWFVVFQSLRYVQLFATSWTITHQAPLSMRFSRQEYWGGLPCPPQQSTTQQYQEHTTDTQLGQRARTLFLSKKTQAIPRSYYCGVYLYNNQNMMIVEMEDRFSGCQVLGEMDMVIKDEGSFGVGNIVYLHCIKINILTMLFYYSF